MSEQRKKLQVEVKKALKKANEANFLFRTTLDLKLQYEHVIVALVKNPVTSRLTNKIIAEVKSNKNGSYTEPIADKFDKRATSAQQQSRFASKALLCTYQKTLQMRQGSVATLSNRNKSPLLSFQTQYSKQLNKNKPMCVRV